MSVIVWQTPIGPLRAVIGENGVRRLEFAPPADKYPLCEGPVQELSRNAADPSASELDQIKRMNQFLTAYFSGRPPARLPDADLSAVSDFDRKVLRACAQIGFGSTSTYGELACSVGHPGAARAIGGAMARNPIPLLVPCHRVVATGSGRLGGFSGGLALKRWLLDHEGHSRQIE